MRDLEIRGAGSLMGAEQHGNLSSVGFDLYTQMLGEAVAQARGEEPADEAATSVTINLPVDYYFSEEYLPEVDKRVLMYRKLAALTDLEGWTRWKSSAWRAMASFPRRLETCSRALASGFAPTGSASRRWALRSASSRWPVPRCPNRFSTRGARRAAQVFAKTGKVNYPHAQGRVCA